MGCVYFCFCGVFVCFKQLRRSEHFLGEVSFQELRGVSIAVMDRLRDSHSCLCELIAFLSMSPPPQRLESVRVLGAVEMVSGREAEVVAVF